MSRLSLFRHILLLVVVLLSQSVGAESGTTSLANKAAAEYALPAAEETHEILSVSDESLLITQQTNGNLVKVALDRAGRPVAARKWKPASSRSGIHGLALHAPAGGSASSATVWVTLQYDNVVLHMDPSGSDVNAAPRVINTIPMPSPARGPHGIVEHNGSLWITCKDSAHIVRISIDNPNDHQVWAVSEKPIFVAVHPTSGDVYASLLASNKIWHYKNDGGAGNETAVPPELGTAPCGLVAAPDGNLWVALLGNSTAGTGTFGRINADASLNWFHLSSAIGKTAPLIHLAFGDDPSQLWLLGSTSGCNTCVDAVFAVQIDNSTSSGTAKPRVAIQNTVFLPTQRSWTHRMINLRGELYVTELKTSSIAHVSGATVAGAQESETWDRYGSWGQGLSADFVMYANTTAS